MTFQDILDRYGVPVAPASHEHHRAGWINFDCPWCSPKWGHYRMGFNTRGSYVSCWACGPHRLIDTLIEITGENFRVLKDLAKDLTKSAIPSNIPVSGKLVVPKYVGELKKAHLRYLLSRQIDVPSLKALWGVQGIGVAPRLSGRLYIPIHYRGEVVSWTTRSIHDNHATRYHSASPSEERMPHKSLLYGEDYVRGTVIVCEGPTDVWKVGPGAVCTFGVGFKRAQLLKIAQYPVRVICYDTEPEGIAAAKKLADYLMGYPGETYVVTLDAKDPGSASPKEIKKLRKAFLV